MKLRHVHHWTFDKLICAIIIICLAVVLVLVLVLKDSLRTYFKSLSWSLGVRSLSGQVQEVLVLVLGSQVLVNIPGQKFMPLTLKRSRNGSKWVSVKRKKLRQHGHAYIMSSDKMAEGKSVQCCKIDHENCRFKCAKKFDELARQAIHMGHW